MNRLLRIVRVGPLLGLSMALTVLLGCITPGGSTGTRPGDDTVLPDYSSQFRAGDKLTIQFTEPGMPSPWEQTIGEDGMISLPHNQSVRAEGKTRAQLEDAIRDVYVPNLYRRMSPNVRSEDRYYFVRGEVKNPSQLKYISSMTVLKAIAAAGDFTDFADRRDVKVIRANGEQMRVDAKRALRDPAQDVPIYPGDTIFVERRF